MLLKVCISLSIFCAACTHTGKPLHGGGHELLTKPDSQNSIPDCRLQANIKNAYDSAGILYYHNIAQLDKLANPDFPINTVVSSRNCFNPNDAVKGSWMQPYSPTIAAIQSILNDAKNEYAGVINSNLQTIELKKSITSLLKTLLNMSAKNRSFIAIQKAIMKLEKNTLQHKRMPAAERKTILQACSIARYCVCYWINKLAITPTTLRKFALSRLHAICVGTIAVACITDCNKDIQAQAFDSALASAMLFEYTEPN